jgi:hypothetical protein
MILNKKMIVIILIILILCLLLILFYIILFNNKKSKNSILPPSLIDSDNYVNLYNISDKTSYQKLIYNNQDSDPFLLSKVFNPNITTITDIDSFIDKNKLDNNCIVISFIGQLNWGFQDPGIFSTFLSTSKKLDNAYVSFDINNIAIIKKSSEISLSIPLFVADIRNTPYYSLFPPIQTFVINFDTTKPIDSQLVINSETNVDKINTNFFNTIYKNINFIYIGPIPIKENIPLQIDQQLNTDDINNLTLYNIKTGLKVYNTGIYNDNDCRDIKSIKDIFNNYPNSTTFTPQLLTKYNNFKYLIIVLIGDLSWSFQPIIRTTNADIISSLSKLKLKLEKVKTVHDNPNLNVIEESSNIIIISNKDTTGNIFSIPSFDFYIYNNSTCIIQSFKIFRTITKSCSHIDPIGNCLLYTITIQPLKILAENQNIINNYVPNPPLPTQTPIPQFAYFGPEIQLPNYHITSSLEVEFPVSTIPLISNSITEAF